MRQSFQLLKAASLRDTSFLQKLAKKRDVDSVVEQELGDAMEVNVSTTRDPWGCVKTGAAKSDLSPARGNTEYEEELDSVPRMWQSSESPQIIKNKTQHTGKQHPQEPRELKAPAMDPKFSCKLSSDSEISSLSKTEMFRSSLFPIDVKRGKKAPIGAHGPEGFKEMSDFNFSRVEASPSTVEMSEVVLTQEDVTASGKVGNLQVWNMKKGVHAYPVQLYRSDDEEEQFIIAKYFEDSSSCETRSPSSQKGGIQDIMIIRRGAKTRRTLGNFENNVRSDLNVQGLYPGTPLRELPYNREEKRVASLIDKYASGNRCNRASLEKNWNSCRPLVLNGASKDRFCDTISHHHASKLVIHCDSNTQRSDDTLVNKPESPLERIQSQNMNSSEAPKETSVTADVTLPESKVNSCQLSAENDVSSESVRDVSINKDVPSYELLQDDSVDHSPGTPDVGHSLGASQSMKELNQDRTLNYEETLQENNTCQKLIASASLKFRPSTQVVGGCDLLQGHGSRNLNNCEPLKCHATDMESTHEGEDRLEFEVTQVFFPESQPRSVRVCTVRPISSEAENSGTGQRKKRPSADVLDPASKPDPSPKYENLRPYEVTAGQFTAPTRKSLSAKRDNTRHATTLNNSNKRTDFAGVSCQATSVADCLKSPSCAAVCGHDKKCSLDDRAETNNKTHRGMSCYRTAPPTGFDTTCVELTLSGRQNFTDQPCQTKNISDKAAHHISKKCYSAAARADRAREERLEVMSGNEQGQVYNSEQEMHSKNSEDEQTMSAVNHDVLGSTYVAPNTFIKQAGDDGELDSDETVPKTLYVSELSEAEASIRNTVGRTKSHVDESNEEKEDLRSSSTANLVSNIKTQEIELTRTTVNTTINLSSDVRDGPEVNADETKFPVNNSGICTHFFQSDSNITEGSSQSEDETQSRRPEQNGCELSQSGRVSESTCESPEPLDHQEERFIGQFSQQRGNYSHSETLTRPFKSSLKKTRVVFSLNEEKTVIENRQYQAQIFPLRTPDRDTDGLCCPSMETELEKMNGQEMSDDRVEPVNTGKTLRCVKQVRFDNTIHYYDNVELDTIDSIASADNAV